MKRLACLLILLTGCQTAKDFRQTGNVHTLGYFTGSHGHNWYDDRFESGAEKTCGGKNYKVLEKSATPSTLADSPALKDDAKFYWVIECLN